MSFGSESIDLRSRTYDTALEVVARPAQQDLFLFDLFLRRHFPSTGEKTRIRWKRICESRDSVEDELRSDRSACCRSLKSLDGRSEEE